MLTNFNLLDTKVDEAISRILINDQLLIKKGQELALSNKMGMYLFSIFHGWDVDCEYNRIGIYDEQKRSADYNFKRPDIIIHKRGLKQKENNLLWIEVKINNDQCTDDISKIKDFTRQPEGYREIQYQYGLSISFIPEIQKKWIQNGEVIN